MEEHDDWKLGDEGEATVCPGCGKRNRAGLKDCIICGRSLVDEPESGPDALRTIGEAMGSRPPRARQAPPRRSLRAWSIALVLLLGVVVVLTWLQTREEPFRLEDWTGSTAPEPMVPPTVATATAVATAVVTATPRPHPTVVATVAVVVEPTVIPPVPTVVRAIATPTRRPPPPPKKSRPVIVPPPPAPAPPPPPPPVAVEPNEEPTPVDRPRSEATEKPSLGSDLQEVTREYRQAVDVHNARVDEYNAVADEIQRRGAWDDSEASVALRRRLDRARDAVEGARMHAELLRSRMESVRARYR